MSDLSLADLGRENPPVPLSDMAKPQSFAPRVGIDIVGPGIVSAPLALLQMIDSRGLSPAQLDRNSAMRGPLYAWAMREHPELLAQKREPTPAYNQTDRRMLAEDLNSVKIKYDNWRKAQTGQELTPQERITQSFVDVRNPNSSW